MTSLRDELEAAPLGHATSYPDTYDAALLFRVPRLPQRQEIGISGGLPFTGSDGWTAFELTWLDLRGKPEVAILSFEVPAVSTAIVESKSVKLYLGSFAQTPFADADAVKATIARDLAAAVGAGVAVTLVAPSAFAQLRIAELPGASLDGLAVAIDRYEVDPSLLAAIGPSADEALRTDLFRSLCPVTGQPDFASIGLAYRGPRIDRAGLLRYLVSYRNHLGFHEHCAERIFVDVMTACRCEALSVNARFTRRGGVDINPFRTNAGLSPPPNVRNARQ
ncbi:MAG: NADPH-dependent 7-cyano-7-deazaguanine reductase QueF [Casimicrobiaceae bacterium]